MKRSAPLAHGDSLSAAWAWRSAESSKMVRYARRVGFSLWIRSRTALVASTEVTSRLWSSSESSPSVRKQSVLAGISIYVSKRDFLVQPRASFNSSSISCSHNGPAVVARAQAGVPTAPPRTATRNNVRRKRERSHWRSGTGRRAEALAKRVQGLKRADELFEWDQAAIAELLQAGLGNGERYHSGDGKRTSPHDTKSGGQPEDNRYLQKATRPHHSYWPRPDEDRTRRSPWLDSCRCAIRTASLTRSTIRQRIRRNPALSAL